MASEATSWRRSHPEIREAIARALEGTAQKAILRELWAREFWRRSTNVMKTYTAQTDVRMDVSMTVNGSLRTLRVEPRTTLLDALRDELALTGPKKSCDRGECGACTVHIEGRRVLSCMTLAAMHDGQGITTIA